MFWLFLANCLIYKGNNNVVEKLVPISERYLELQKDIAEGKREIEKLRLESDERRHRLEIEDRKSQRERDVEREKRMFDLFKSLAQTKNNN